MSPSSSAVSLTADLRPTYDERIASMNRYYREKPPAKQEIEYGGSPIPISIEKTFERYLV